MLLMGPALIPHLIERVRRERSGVCLTAPERRQTTEFDLSASTDRRGPYRPADATVSASA